MTKARIWAFTAFGLLMAVVALGQTTKIYPGAKKYTPDTDETKEAAKQAEKATPPGMQQAIYMSDDPYEKVAAFYRGAGKEYILPGMRGDAKLPSGQPMLQSFFLLDGASDLQSSRNWVKVQRPFIGSVSMKDGVPEFKDIRDVTAIIVVEKK